MHQFASDWFHYLAAMLWQSSLVMIVIFGVYFTILKRQSAALRYALLCLILIKMALPPSFQLQIGIGSVAPKIFALVHSSKMPTAISPSTLLPNENTAEPAQNNQPVSVSTSLEALRGSLSSTSQWDLPTIAFACWGISVLSLLILQSIRLLRIRKRFAKSTLNPDDILQNIVDISRQRMRCWQSVGAYRSTQASSPMVMGIFRPRIIFPAHCTSEISRSELTALVCHELGHIQRFDLLANFAQLMLQIVWFFHPGIWIANRLIRKEREMACDDIARSISNIACRKYAAAVLKMVPSPSAQLPAMTTHIGLFMDRTTTYTRIKRLIQETPAAIPFVKSFEKGLLLIFALVMLPLAYNTTTNKTQRDFIDVSTFANTSWIGSKMYPVTSSEILRMCLSITLIHQQKFSGYLSWGYDDRVDSVYGEFKDKDSIIIHEFRILRENSLSDYEWMKADELPIENSVLRAQISDQLISGIWTHPTDAWSGAKCVLMLDK